MDNIDLFLEWIDESSWTSFRGSKHAHALITFLESVAPECIATSKSERIALPPRYGNRPPLPWGYQEIRTVYFKPTMDENQKRRLEKAEYPVHCYSPDGIGTVGHRSTWGWLHGLREFHGRSAVAARYILDWKTLKLEREYTQTKQVYNGGPMRKVSEIFDDELRAAGIIGFESVHCTFDTGNWLNN